MRAAGLPTHHAAKLAAGSQDGRSKRADFARAWGGASEELVARIKSAHSTCCIFESRMTFAHWAISAFIRVENSSGVSISAV
jgi:hypothetical protein